MPRSSAEKMRAYRARKRAAGLRLVQIWAIDTRTPEFKKEAERQSAVLRQSEAAQRDMDFVEAFQAENLNLPKE